MLPENFLEYLKIVILPRSFSSKYDKSIFAL